MPQELFCERFSDRHRVHKDCVCLDRELVLAVPLDLTPSPETPTLFAYLPVPNQRSGLPLLLHSDFKVVVSRESLPEVNLWNDALLEELPEAFCGLIQRWRDNDSLVDRIPQLFPEVKEGEFCFDDRTPKSIRACLRTAIEQARELEILRSPRGNRYVTD